MESAEILGATTTIKPIYTRTTELRHVRENDIYELTRILDESDCWRQLMEIIPKRLDAQASSAAGALNYAEAIGKSGYKYTSGDISQIEQAYRRMNNYQFHSQIMLDEWKTSGKNNERPTLGVLLQLLTQAELFRAADFVAEKLLNEPKPPRPSDGPAAAVEWGEETAEIMDVDSDAISLPCTQTLNDNARIGHTEAFNKDFFTKHIVMLNKNVSNLKADNATPVPPPRTSRLTRQLLEQQQHQTHPLINHHSSSSLNTNNVISGIRNINKEQVSLEDGVAAADTQSTSNLPKLSLLRATILSSNNMEYNNIANVSTTKTNDDDAPINHNMTILDNRSLDAPIPMVTLLLDNMTNDAEVVFTSSNLNSSATASTSTSIITTTAATVTSISGNLVVTSNDNLPLISELNLLGERDGQEPTSESSSSQDDDVDDDGDTSLPNLSNFEQRSSNNDSSLTTVTGTSGDNSFELTNDSSSTSNDDNIPRLSALQP